MTIKHVILALGLALAALPACHHRQPEGPAQRAGAAVDDAARKTKDGAQDAAHDVKKDVNGP